MYVYNSLAVSVSLCLGITRERGDYKDAERGVEVKEWDAEILRGVCGDLLNLETKE